MSTQSDKTLLQVEGMKTYFPFRRGIFNRETAYIKAVDGIDLTLTYGETLGLVGESGCGKSTAGRSILQIIRPTSGSVKFENAELTALNRRALIPYRQKMQIIFQDPYASLNPRHKIRHIIRAPLDIHKLDLPHERQKKVAELLEVVGLRPDQANNYPHEFSGGQRQRIGIARALASNPALIICDEPVSALDVSVQAQVINLLNALQEKFGLTYLFISHD